MKRKTRSIANLELNANRPTEVTFDQVYTWVIWQFPRKARGGHCGAVRPPIANHSWLPAAIWPENERLIIHGHLNEAFDSPDDAANWLEKDA